VGFAAGLGLGLAAAAIAIAGYIAWGRLSDAAGGGDREPPPPSISGGRFQLQMPPGVELVPTGVASVLAVSPNGQWVAFLGFDRRTNETALYLRPIGELELKKIPVSGIAPFFSPDSRWLGFFAGTAMYKVSVADGRPELICNLPNITSVRGASWSDNDTIVFSSEKALWRVSAAGGEPVALTRPQSDVRHYWPYVLPGSAAVLFTIAQGNSDARRHIGVASLKSGDVSEFPAISGTASRYVRGRLVYSRSGVLQAASFNLSRLAVMGEPVKILDHVQTFSGSGSVAFDVSASGSLVYIPGSDRMPPGELLWLDRQGKIAGLLEQRPRLYIGVALAPDGKRLAASLGDDLGESDLWVYELDRETRTKLTAGMQVWSELAWSPDGKWVFFTSFKSGEAELYRVPSGGGSAEQLTSDPHAWEHAGSVSGDGTLLFWKAAVSQTDLMMMKLEPRGAPQPMTNTPGVFESSPRISPDGHWVAYESNESGSHQIHVRPFPGPGEGLRVSTDGGWNPWWSRDGRELFYQSNREVWAVVVEPGRAFRHRAPRTLLRYAFSESSNDYIVYGEMTGRLLAIRRDRPDHRLVYIPNWLDELNHAVRQPQ
jgi:serine/threonine-protein kinase